MLFKMLSKKDTKEERNPTFLPAESKEAAACKDEDNHTVQQVESRRLLYERIARGNALAEAEENARYKWHG